MKNISIFFKDNNYLKFNRFLKGIFFTKRMFGPDTLRENLLRGLKKNSIKFNINPKYEEIFENCVVLDDVEKLKDLINLKKKKRIKIIAGPNLMIMPNEYDKILYKKQINKIIVPSLWVKKKYLEVSKNKLKNKIYIWASGIDHKYWRPLNNKKSKILIYSKYIRDNNIYNKCINFLKRNKLKYVLIKYGNYNSLNYLSLLRSSSMVIFFSESESQGLAYFEAWSTNVPTLVYNPRQAYRMPYKTKSNSCPYLNKELGDEFNTFKDFKIKFVKLVKNRKLKPRNLIIKNFSLKKSANKFIKLI